jgi:hypothetical protein
MFDNSVKFINKISNDNKNIGKEAKTYIGDVQSSRNKMTQNKHTLFLP